MQKRYKTIQQFHDLDPEILFSKYERKHFRVGLLSETSSDVVFTSIIRNIQVVDLSGTKKHLTRMDGIFDETPTQPGDVCLVPPGLEVRLAWIVSAERTDNITIEFDSTLFEACLPEFAQDKYASGHLLARNYARCPVLADLAGLLAREIAPHQRRGRLFADSAMRLLILEIAASCWSVPMPMPMPMPMPLPKVDGGIDTRVKRAINFIESRFADDISLSDISLASGLSLPQLTARFQQHTGSTPYSCVIDRRLRQAGHLLSTTDMPIAHVAIETGFSDQQHMTRGFRARLGKTPSQVRKR